MRELNTTLKVLIEFIKNLILYQDYRVVLSGVEENAKVTIDSCEYLEQYNMYHVEATLIGGNAEKGMEGHYAIDCRYLDEEK